MSPHVLDNPVWAALGGPHSPLAVTVGRFRRYRSDVGPFIAVADPKDGYEGIAEAIPVGMIVGIVTPEPIEIPSGVELHALDAVPQMVAEGVRPPTRDVPMRPLGDADVPAMLELTQLTHPGPFSARTIETGAYLGCFDGDQLVAMAGERMRVPGFTEVSAVCTHPDYQGRGYGKALVTAVATKILLRGEVPFLHVRAHNAVAIGAYEKVGFSIRRTMRFTTLKRP
jgi:GNAT superfamily N-acetyltransferase